jgi:hypothetical protein
MYMMNGMLDRLNKLIIEYNEAMNAFRTRSINFKERCPEFYDYLIDNLEYDGIPVSSYFSWKQDEIINNLSEKTVVEEHIKYALSIDESN